MSVIPPKLLNINILQVNPVGYWDSDDGMGDPWLGYPYQWEITCTVSPQFHSSHLTREPYIYHGMDVMVGDWLSDFLTAAAVKVISINQALTNSEQVVCVVEDVDRYNTFTDPTGSGNGVCQGGQGIIFTLGDDGMPVFGNFTPYYAALSNNLAFQNDIEARFRHRNLMTDYIFVNQPNHGLNIGDALEMNGTGLYAKANNGASVNKILGTVTDVSSNGIVFSYRPIGKYVDDLEFMLPGNPGDLIYIGSTGELTNIPPTYNVKPLYIRLDTPHKAICIEQGTIPTQTQNSLSTLLYTVPMVSNGQTEFTLPEGVVEVLSMTINGMENTNYTFDVGSRILIFDHVSTGYGVEYTDDVLFLCKSFL